MAPGTVVQFNVAEPSAFREARSIRSDPLQPAIGDAAYDTGAADDCQSNKRTGSSCGHCGTRSRITCRVVGNHLIHIGRIGTRPVGHVGRNVVRDLGVNVMPKIGRTPDTLNPISFFVLLVGAG